MKRIFALAVVLAALLVVSAPSAALAAQVTEYQIQYTPVAEGGASQMIVTAVLAPEASLPATVSVPVPAGATLLWSGELLGGDVADDPFREASVERVGEMDVYTFTLEQSHLGQVEVTVGAPSIAGKRVESVLRWSNPGEAVLVSLSVVAEPGAGDVRIDGAAPSSAPQVNQAGETLYLVGSRTVQPGESFQVATSWVRGGGRSQSLPVVLIVAGAALVAAVVTLVVLLVRERRRAEA